ncbi:MAG TPA: hypothetical protein VGJ00_10200 [Rhabdochlamydiaceae bacterium]
MRSLIFSFFFLLACRVAFTNEYFEEKMAHECGLSVVRLRKPLAYYCEQYNDPAWGVKKLLSLMEKQRNRGQDGAGIAAVQFNMPSGQEYLQHLRSASHNAIESVFDHVMNDLNQFKGIAFKEMGEMEIKRKSSFIAEALMGHVRYATHSGVQLKFCQPFVRSHGVACRHFALAGNFNMTNTSDMFQQLQAWGLSPTSHSDTQVVLEMIAHYLDKEYKRIVNDNDIEGDLSRIDLIFQKLDLRRVISEAAVHWDGGYVFCGLLGNGDVFICRDPSGIRPGYYFVSDEVFAAASEKVALMDVFDLNQDEVLPIQPGHVIVIKQNGEIIESTFAQELPERHCTFERIYFSRSSDPQIYEERKALGRGLAQQVLEALGQDTSHAIFTYAPNSSLSAFQGLVEQVTHLTRQKIMEEMLKEGQLDLQQIKKLTGMRVRTEYLITKNQKLRTFISSDGARKNLVAELYDVTKGIVTPDDILIVVDDSIVRGTTLRESLMRKLINLNPKKIIIVSSAPPVCYPDCYGIDMSQLGPFVAFRAAVALHEERGDEKLIDEIYASCASQQDLPAQQMQNHVKKIYEGLSLPEISQKVAEFITPSDLEWKGEIQIIYQTIEGLHKAMCAKGDWYFSGDYPTPGGTKVLNTSFLKWYEGDDARAY